MPIARWIALAIALLPLPALAQDVAALQKAAAAGDARAQVDLGKLYAAGHGVPRDDAAAFSYYAKAAAAGNAEAMNELGWCYKLGRGVAVDYALAFKYFSQASAAGNVGATNNLGTLYEQGQGVPRDPATAFKYYAQAAAAGGPEATNNVGLFYRRGLVVARDPAMAAQYFSKAAALGSTRAMNNLANQYARGDGVPRDLGMAFKYFAQSAAAGDHNGQTYLGLMYKNGRAVPKDIGRAIALFETAGRGGSGAAYFNLGLIYRDNLDGVPPDPGKANGYFAKAVALGYTQARSFTVSPPPPGPPPPPPPPTGYGDPRDLTAVGNGGAVAPPSPPALTGAKVPAGPRLALVIANGDYAPYFNPLKNPVNDGKLIADALGKAGFAVTHRDNLTIVQMKQAVADFVDALHKAGPNATALFYYAGHGAAAQGVNYLIPVGQDIRNQTGLQSFGQSADDILKLLDSARPVTTIVILDACRNVPFPNARGAGDGGLTQMNARNGSIIAYSTAPGQTAEDGDGADSPYAAALADIIQQSHDPVEIVFRKVRARVIGETDAEQTPWESTSLVSDFSFLP